MFLTIILLVIVTSFPYTTFRKFDLFQSLYSRGGGSLRRLTRCTELVSIPRSSSLRKNAYKCLSNNERFHMSERIRWGPETKQLRLRLQIPAIITLSVTVSRFDVRRRRLHCAYAVRSLQDLLYPHHPAPHIVVGADVTPFEYHPPFLEHQSQRSTQTDQR
jgi:hypothetical protein